MNGHLPKPFKQEDLADVLQRFLLQPPRLSERAPYWRTPSTWISSLMLSGITGRP
jgi:hypothetical protein